MKNVTATKACNKLVETERHSKLFKCSNSAPTTTAQRRGGGGGGDGGDGAARHQRYKRTVERTHGRTDGENCHTAKTHNVVRSLVS